MDNSAFDRLKRLTRARIGLGRAGDSLPTRAQLDFQMAHALARDAVHGAVDWSALREKLAAFPTIDVASAATERAIYLRRPDLGRALAPGEADKLPAGPFDIVVIVGDGLSAAACNAHAADVMYALAPRLPGLTLGPIVFARGARVALSDAIGAAMGARLAIMLIGERPGLSSADSLGAYLTFSPGAGRRDSERNCVSNIHANGLAAADAAARIAWLAREALRLGLSGVALKEAAPARAELAQARSLTSDPRRDRRAADGGEQS